MAPPSATEVDAVTDTQGVTLPDPLTAPITANDAYGRRKKYQKSHWGVAAPAHSDMFKSPRQMTKPKAKRWDHRLNTEAHSRTGNSLKQAARFLSTPGIISLGGGLPSSQFFPFDSLSIKVPAPGHFSESETYESGVTLHAGKHDLATDASIFDIATAFNYGQGTGSAQLLRFVTEHTEMCHDPPYGDWNCNLSIGSTSALDMAFRMFTQRGDVILSEEYTFVTAVETAAPMGVKVVGVKMDSEGLLPSALDEILSSWDENVRGAKKPFLLYTVPSGQNPTGATQGAERRRSIYKLAQKHDLYIIEDEPYYFLQMQPYTGAHQPPAPLPTSHAEFLASLVPSLLSMDTDGRVLRLDSFSKVLSPGARVGWITASNEVVEKYRMHADVSTQSPSGPMQLILFKLLEEHWGHGGYLDWLLHVRVEYTRRRDVILAACERYLPTSIVSWEPPMAGMFHWLRVNWRLHPSAGTKSITEIEEEIFMNNIENGTLLMRGSWFYADRDAEHDTMFFRATYAAAPFDKIEEGIRRFGESLRKSFKLEESNGVGNRKV
ncbi:PLP-dependent transferase [Patellaria atrata CBS 101060]|uniref:aromatic-amino-acid transaminase n=1 Tax=Patellaria atrata CBS 101060 TaxID=1346257 RepID=A0A9P4S5Q1_9PEZI|nr:PLP-dependent transferase [Patellaria atrata CBS 101060]